MQVQYVQGVVNHYIHAAKVPRLPDVDVTFNPSVELWDTSQKNVNLSEELLAKLTMMCMQQSLTSKP